ncbi:uncharacterized protein LOC113230503 [Hyposmocoma kahamanoa]|uniref:uncharacterized protein LOC113230503 n=1 Tax=Hyposmocoma kahamanoa TaxID=1477025 RepID=UPI000E6D8EA9|nr:uncharacterized protein LOC113230503 [Hyposmocoma kahamanoa]
MAEAMEGGSSLAWRLLATLEGGSLVLVTTALLAYTARRKLARKKRLPTRQGRDVHSVLITNTTNALGSELKKQLQLLGTTVIEGATNGAGADKVDALVVVGAESRASGLDGMAELVSQDIYENMKILDTLSPRVNDGGYIAWACAGAVSETYSGATNAFDSVLEASLSHIAEIYHCQPLWVGRCDRLEEASDRIIAALMPCATQPVSRFSIRHAAHKVTGYIGRWLKIAT